jgi:signal transduction histidine kinase
VDSNPEGGRLGRKGVEATDLPVARAPAPGPVHWTRSELLAHASHELRDPLNTIIGFAELMSAGKVGSISDDHKEYLGDIVNSSHHLLDVIDGLLDIARLASGSMEFCNVATDPGRVVAEVREVLDGLASSKRIRVDAEIDSALAGAVLDPSKLRDVLRSYLSNALKFTLDGGHVTMRVLRDGPQGIRVEVVDTGIGIRPEDTHRLFVEFQQLDAGMAKKCPGTGLGLALTRRIVEAQGGRVGVRSEVGKGSTFWAVLPCGQPGDTPRGG